MDETGKVRVRFSEVCWYDVDVSEADLREAYGQDIAGVAGLTEDDMPDPLHELLGGLVGDSGGPYEIDGREIHSVTRVIQGEG